MIKEILKENNRQLEEILDSLTAGYESATYHSVVEAMRYSLLAGGKRIRPTVLLEFYALCGGQKNFALPFAAAVECIHTYSLIHDDLPCMDNDDMRRGKPSCHKAFGEATALLAGDGLLTLAFEAMANAKETPADRVVQAISELARLAGISGMIGGQVIDLQSEGKPVDRDCIIEMYTLKTGALLRAAADIGCLLAGASAEQRAAACRYAADIGLAFQIVDDILDAEGDAQALGKPTGSDEKNCKSTYVSFVGPDEAKQTVADLTRRAKSALTIFEGDTSALEELADLLADRNR